MIEILEKTKDFAVIFKPAGVPSQADKSGDADALTLTSKALAELGEPEELYLIHRLDRVVGGLLVFARSKTAAAKLSEQFSGVGAEKRYLAVVAGDTAGGEMTDLLAKDAAGSRAVVVTDKRHGAKEARLVYRKLATVSTEGGVRSLVDIELITGRFHQIRAQFSSRGHALVGDAKYGSRDRGARAPALFAYCLAFSLNGRSYRFSRFPDGKDYPWSLFNLAELEI